MSSADPLEDLLSIRLKLRPDVRCAIHEAGGQPYYQIEDPLNSNFYRLGAREWAIARQLDGKSTLKEVVEQHQASGHTNSLTLEEAIGLGRWLVHTQLATHRGMAHPLYARSAHRSKVPGWLNPAFMKIPLGNPDQLLTHAAPWMLWTLSPIAFVFWVATMLAAIYQIALQWSRFSEPIQTIFSPDNWLYLLIVWVLLKVVHEFYHGLVCKKYGGRVPNCGLMLILFSPVAYVDVTSSWKFRSKWQRIFTAAAGMYVELFIAAIAALVWARTDHALLSQMCQNVIMTAGLSTLLFNGNFLMRFDGYYILSDLLGLQNLYANGQQYVRYLFRRYLLAVSAKPPLPGRLGWIVKLYGPASLAWRISFYIGILLTAATMFRGAGVVISLMIATLWIVIPTAKFVNYLIYGRGNEQPDRIRCAIVLGSCAIILTAILQLPWPGGIIASGVVEYEPLSVVRARTDGFLRTWHVSPGQSVDEGSPLVTLENPQTLLDLQDVDGRIHQAEIELLVLRDEKKFESLVSKARDLRALEDERYELTERADALNITAPSAGRVIVRDQDSLVDQYVQGGEAILAVGDEDHKSVVALVAQKDVEFFLKQVGTHPRIRIRGRLKPIENGTLVKVNPRANRKLAHPGLAAPNGGPLAVVPNTGDENDEEGGFDLVEPHFTATVSLSQAQSAVLRAGEIAKIRIGAAGESIGAHLLSQAGRWIRQRLTPER